MEVVAQSDYHIDEPRMISVGDFLDIEEDFLCSLGEKLGEIYTIKDMLGIMESYSVGHEEEWINKIDKILEEIEIRDDFSEYIVEMEKIREVIMSTLCTFLMCPRFLALIIAASSFLLEILTYTGCKNLKELYKLEENNNLLITQMLKRICLTVHYMTIKFATKNAKSLVSNEKASPLDFSEETPEFINGKLFPDKQTWIEYNEYLERRGDVLTSESNKCVIC